MLLTTRVLVLAAVLYSGGDSVKKKATTPPPDTPAKAPPAAPHVAKTPTIGAAIINSMMRTVREAAPRTTYLDAALKARIAGGPPVPAKFHAPAATAHLVADSIVVEKGRRTLTLYLRGSAVKKYLVALGKNPVGPKVSQGDGRTPEGLYHIEAHNPDSKYHLSLKVSYPNAADVASAKARGVSTGGDIMIHGLPPAFADYGPAHRQWDWTEGCIAVTNEEIEEIWSAVGDGAAIQIKP